MAYSPADEIMLPPSLTAATGRPERSRLAAFVPITLAVLGVSAILFGHISADNRPVVDPISTGSIYPAAAGEPTADVR